MPQMPASSPNGHRLVALSLLQELPAHFERVTADGAALTLCVQALTHAVLDMASAIREVGNSEVALRFVPAGGE